MDEIIAEFTAEMVAEKGPESGTPRTYTWAANNLREYMEASGTGLQEFDASTWQEFGEWLKHQKNESHNPWSALTLRTAVRGAKAFCQWAAGKGYCNALEQADWALVNTNNPEEQEGADGMSPEQQRQYFAALAVEPEPYKTIFTLLPQTGQRIREICAAPLLGVQKINGQIVMHVRRQGDSIGFKEIGSFDRNACAKYLHPVPLGVQASATIRTYLDVWRREFQKVVPNSPWLFPSRINSGAEAVPRDTALKEFAAFRDRAGLGGITTDIAGRNTVAAQLIDDGEPIERVAEILGVTVATAESWRDRRAGSVQSISSEISESD